LRRRAQVLIGDNDISFGEGDRTVVFAADQIPAGASPDFARLRHRLPTALVTGTNGKTTTVRLLARMMQEAGLRAGFCCTDSVEVAGEVLDRDDYSGPGGTRRVLRHANTEAAVLEVARGGLLRRGLGVRDADVAIVTNIAEDHLHDMGVHTLAQMAEVKFLLAGSLARGAPLVTNASNRWCRAAAVRTGRPILWFAANSKSRRLLPKRARSIGFATIVDGVVQLERGRRTIELMPMADAPLTLGGAAAHNVENLLAAASAALALRLPREAIVSAARQFGARPDDNRGRNNSFAINGATVIADFGHNPDSLRAVFATARALRSGRLAISLGQAGDRDDAAIRALGALAAAERPDLLILKDMEKYRRGRAAGDIPTLLAAGARAGGLAADQTRVVATDQESLDVVLPWLGPGDLAVLFVHTDVDAVLARLAGLAQPR
jgi:UDP-N-acetylmuramyl tripeptide synthase